MEETKKEPEIKREARKIVIPGEVVGNSKSGRAGYGTYFDGDKIVSTFLGILREIKGYLSVVPLAGIYVPDVGDKIIGVIISVQKFGWIVDINSPWKGFLSLSEGVDQFVDKRVDISRFFDVGDVIYAEVQDVRRGADIQLSMKSPIARKLRGGMLTKITPSKVPRLIGKSGSMIDMIKEKTKTVIRVGQNGIVWLNGEDTRKAVNAVKVIDEKSHVMGLTDKISKLLG